MSIRIAFAGFRHVHIQGLYNLAAKRDDVEIVAACEPDAETRAALAEAGKVEVPHQSADELFAADGFDLLAIGDVYVRRGAWAIRALAAGLHVISDKPLCTSLAELDEIAAAAAAGGLSVGCMLTNRGNGRFRALRRVLRDGAIGGVHTVAFSGQHPLMRGTRPEWYFKPGCHGGTINDIAIHALDMIPWLTGRRIVEVVAARAWNARVSDADWFQDGAQLMLRMDNDGGVLGDVSYLSPDEGGYDVPQYWRVTLHGDAGLAEVTPKGSARLWKEGRCETIGPDPDTPGSYLDDLLAEIAGLPPANGALTTDQVIASSRLALIAQQAADEGRCRVACE
jgi:predicted dehydrogenase